MKTEDLLKIKYFLVCAFAAYCKQSEKSPDISIDNIIRGINRINDKLDFHPNWERRLPKTEMEKEVLQEMIYKEKNHIR